MKLEEIYNNVGKLKISFEVFPPKDEDSTQNLLTELDVLKSYNPVFVSLTWGAGGNDNRSLSLVENIKSMGLDVMPHFTCVCSSKDFVLSHINKLKSLNIDKILALRGDIPPDNVLCGNDFHYANELVEFIKDNSDLSVGVAGYPEGHIEADSLELDIENLKKKVDAGAEAIFTQLFYDNEKLFRYMELLSKYGIDVPVISGIMPILSKKQIDKMTNMAKITIPKNLQDKIEKYQHSNIDMQKMGVDYVSGQCEQLIKFGVSNLHFFTLNKSIATKSILDNIL